MQVCFCKILVFFQLMMVQISLFDFLMYWYFYVLLCYVFLCIQIPPLHFVINVNAHNNVMLQCLHVLYIFAQQCGYDLYVCAFLLYILLPVCVAYVGDCCVSLHLCVNETLPEFSIPVYMKSCLYKLCIWPLHYTTTSIHHWPFHITYLFAY